MAKFGVHVKPGSRNGYGNLCAAKPAVVIAIDEGGALVEAIDKSSGYAFTIFRDTSVYIEAPPDFNTHPDMVALARFWYPQLKAKWLQNPASYYTMTNEQGGQDTAVMRRLVEYEGEVMRLANADGLKVCILNLATGTPESLDQWQAIFAPFIVEAWATGNVYGRHVYGSGDLVDGSGSVIAGDPSRPFAELGYLRSLGAAGGIALTECGLDAGFGFVGTDRFKAQMGGYEKLLRAYPEFLGLCAWTLGHWEGPGGEETNWQEAIPAMTQYLLDNPTAKWEWPNQPIPPTDPPIPPTPPGRVVTVTNANVRLIPSTSGNTPIGVVPAGTEFVLIKEIPNWYGVQVWVSKQVAEPVEDETPPEPPPTTFRFSHWPTNDKRINQAFGANPDYYAQFNLPGHEGVDIAAAHDSPIYAVAAGTVTAVGDDRLPKNQGGHNYGVRVYIDHDGVYQTVYAHLNSRLVNAGDTVTAGQQIGKANTTGNSSGDHLHLTLKKKGATAAGETNYPLDIVDPTPFLAPLMGTPPPGITYDLLSYMRGDGRQYELQYTWDGGGTHPIQTQNNGSTFYIVKGHSGEYEELYFDGGWIYRGIDTSEAPDKYYTQNTGNKYGAMWAKRHMAIGETVTKSPLVIHYWKEGCQERLRGQPTDKLTLVAHHAKFTFDSGITLDEVIYLEWNQGEGYYFARGYGLVGFTYSGGKSYISEIHEGRPDLQRQAIPCFQPGNRYYVL